LQSIAHPEWLVADLLVQRQERPPASEAERGRATAEATQDRADAWTHQQRDAHVQEPAERLGVRLQVEWVLLAFQYGRADCDIVMDAIADPEAHGEVRLRLSKPYQRSGVALAVRPENGDITGFDSLSQQRRAGVLQGSLAHMYLEQRGARTVPFGFEDDMLQALASGELEAAAATPLSIGYYNLMHPAAQMRLLYAYDAVPELSWDLAIGMRRSDQLLREAIDRAVQAMLDDGTLEKIYAKYGIEHRPPKQQS
jgi:polar amino acid transport system substrate-binding protein